jgi:hypothetical protein
MTKFYALAGNPHRHRHALTMVGFTPSGASRPLHRGVYVTSLNNKISFIEKKFPP